MIFTCFNLRQTESFSVTDPFLTTFYYVYYVEKQNGMLRKNRFQKFTYPYMVVGGSKLPKLSLRN